MAGGGQAAGPLTRCPASKLHCTRNYIHVNLFASFVLKASSVLAIDALLKTRLHLFHEFCQQSCTRARG